MGVFFEQPVVVVDRQIADGFAEVVQKAIADLAAFNNFSGQHRKVGEQVVSAAL